jgi:iron complex outermembrane receptor protein
MAIRGIVYGTASVLAFVASAASAQDSAPSDTPPSGAVTPPGDTGSSEDIIVTGIRGSLRASIEAKRNSDIVADVITAEDIGKFPDKNVAEALQRIPGVVINRTFGEGERVSLRGTAPNLTKTLVNGHAIATADWFIEDQLAATRSFNYLTLPAEIVGQLDVYKSAQADVEEGGIGGTINVHTRHPLDLDAWSLSGSVQGVYSERSDKIDPQASGLLSWKNADETFGILVGAVYQKRRIRRDGVEVLGYTNTTVNGATVQVPSLIGSAFFEQKRERYGANVELQFKPSDTLEVVATGLYSRFNADNFNRNFMAWGSNALGGGGTLTNPVVQNGTVTSGTITSTPTGRAVVYDAIYREAFAQTWSADFDTTWKPTDADTVHFKVGYTKARGDTKNQPFYEGGAPGSFTFNMTDGRVPEVSYAGGIDPNDPSSLIFDFASYHSIGNRDKEKYVYADWEHAVDLGVLSAIKVGGKYTDHDRNTFFLATTYGGFFLPLAGAGCGGAPCTSDDFAGGSTPDDFLQNIGRPGTLSSYFNIDAAKLTQIIQSLPASARARILNPPENFSINEKTYGGYAMAKLGRAGDAFHGNFGVRVIHTEQKSSGNQLGVPANTPGAVTDNAFGVYLPITVKRSYTDILPSVNLALDLSPQFVVRFAAGRTVARPDYTDIVPRVSLNPGALSGDGGDPNVNPYRANSADLSFEFYPDQETIFAAALYYKDIKSYIVNRTVQEVFPVETSTPNLARCQPAGTANANLYNCLFDINRRSNGSGGTNKGIELQASRKIWGPFGAIVNYTYSDAKSDAGDPIPGNSKHALNLTGYFENEWLSTRVSYNYRSKFFINIDRAAQLNQAATESLDASINLRVTGNIAVTADAVNLTNEKIRQYAGEKTAFRGLYDNGRIFYAGVRLKY